MFEVWDKRQVDASILSKGAQLYSVTPYTPGVATLTPAGNFLSPTSALDHLAKKTPSHPAKIVLIMVTGASSEKFIQKLSMINRALKLDDLLKAERYATAQLKLLRDKLQLPDFKAPSFIQNVDNNQISREFQRAKKIKVSLEQPHPIDIQLLDNQLNTAKKNFSAELAKVTKSLITLDTVEVDYFEAIGEVKSQILVAKNLLPPLHHNFTAITAIIEEITA